MGYRMPAEWERHEATWLTWPKDPDTFPPDVLPGVEEAYVEIVRAISPGEQVKIVVDDERMERRVKDLLRGVERVDFHVIRTADVWVRDYGPTYLVGSGRAVVKWGFNAWGNKYEDLLADEKSGEEIARSTGLPIFRPGMVLEGGSFDVDGQGTVLTTEQCLLNPNRNPGLGRNDIEGKLGAFLAASKTLWLGSGIEGDDTDGHVDDIARFLAQGKVAVAREDDRGDPNHGPLAAARLALEEAEDVRGRKIEVLEIPMPPRQATLAGRLPASHLNFYIANDAVLLPAFGGESDGAASAVLQDAFPSREVVRIDCRGLVHGLGTIHCVTQQAPK